MLNNKSRVILSGCAVAAAVAIIGPKVKATDVRAVFVIAMENHNWEQPNPATRFSGGQQQVYLNPNAPYINALVDGSSPISDQVAYATAYHNVLAGTGTHIHPSEPNYIWAEAGSNLGVSNDADPYGTGGTHQSTTAHLSTLLTDAGFSWRSYQEDTDLTGTCPALTNTVRPRDLWTVPVSSCHGSFASGPANEFNGAMQFDYAAKHNPQVFFDDTAGNGDPSTANPQRFNYAPLQQLHADLADDTVADYNWITPNQFNDMHTALSAGFAGQTGDNAKIAQGDNFLSRIIPEIMASNAYKNNGLIVLWWDESEPDGVGDRDDLQHTLPFIIISKNAHTNVDGKPYASTVNLSHSSFLREMQQIFGVGPLLRDAANANDLSDLFKPGNLHETPRGK